MARPFLVLFGNFALGLGVALGCCWATARQGQNGAAPIHDPTRDPRVGSRLSFPSRDYLGRTIPADKPRLLVFLGDCNSCSLHHIDLAKLPLGEFDHIVLVVAAGPADIDGALKTLPKGVEIVCDGSTKNHEEFNSDFLPRWYVLGPGNRLEAFQPHVADTRWSFER